MTKFLKNADVTGYISQTSVTSSLVKTDADGKLVAAVAGTDYNAPGVTASAGTLVREIRNTTGATLTKGTIVYISGATGNKPTVSKALATSDSTSAQTFGMCQTDISNNSNGNVVVIGDIIGLDTSAFTEGAQLYLSSTTAGTYTTTKQLAPAHLVYIGVVTRSHPTQGQIEVKIQNGYELDEIHDVAISSLANNQGLFYESATDLWKNKTIATVLGYTPADDAAVVKLTGNQTVAGVKTFTASLLANNPSEGATGEGLIAGRSFKIDATATGQRAEMYVVSDILSNIYGSGLIAQYANFAGDKGFGFNLNTAGGFELYVKNTSWNKALTIANTKAATFTDTVTATSFIKTGGTSAQFLKADGSVDSSTYLTTGTADSTYLPLSGGTLTGVLSVNSAIRVKSGSPNGILLETYVANQLKIRITPVSTTFDMTMIFPIGASRNYTYPNSDGTIALTSDIPSVAGVYLPLSGGTLTGALGGTSATFSGDVSATNSGFQGRYARIYEASAQRGGLYPYNVVSGAGTDYSIGLFSESSLWFAAGGGVTKHLIIASTGTATFSGGNLEFLGTATGLAGAYFANDNTSFRIHSTYGGGTTKDLIIQSGGSADAPKLILKLGGQVQFTSYTSATSFSGTAAGYLAFDSSGNVITVGSVASTDNTKLPLAGGTVTGQTNFSAATGGSSGQNTVVGVQIQGFSAYASLELGIESNYVGVIRSYGNDIRYYSGHWRTVGTAATEDHSHYWYTSKNGSANWSSTKMQLDQDGNLSIPLGRLLMGTSGTSYISMGRFPNSVSNSGEAWLGRAADRSTGSMTVQLGGGSNASFFEVVDYGWTTVTLRVGMNDFSYKGNAVLHAGNVSSYAVLARGQSNWNDSTVIGNVVGMLSWKNYGNGHVIFDASQGTSPSGGAVNNANSQIAWTGTYPTLMGWNGSNTYGVRVDTARYADSAGSAGSVSNGVYTNATTNSLSGILNFGAMNATPYANPTGTSNGISFGGYESSSLRQYGIFTELENVGGNYSKLTLNYHTGIRLGASTSYGGTRFYSDAVGSGTMIFSVGNGDSNVRVVNTLFIGGNTALHAGNYNSYSPTLTGGGASGTWAISISGNAASATNATNATYASNASGGFTNTGGHGSSIIQNELPAAQNGAATGRVVLRQWCSEPGVTWDWAGFGYNVTNDGGSPSGFGRINTNFGQAYMRFSTSGDLYFYNTNTSGNRVTTMTLSSGGAASFSATVNAAAYRGNANVDGTGEATYHPAGIYSTGNNWLYGSLIMGGNSISGANTISASGLITGGTVRSNTNIYTDQNYGYGLVGVYASTRYQGVFAMGDAYKLPADGTSPGSLYGLSWSHPNAGGQAGYLNDHGLMVMVNGLTYSALSSNIWARGRITATADVYSEGGWFYSYNNAGWYNNTYGQGLRTAKGNVTYGSIINIGENYNGYGGYAITNTYNTIFMQNSGGDHGFFRDGGGGGWSFFYHQNYNCAGIGTDATDPSYSLHIIKYGGSNTGWIIWSDRRIKENIKTIDNALDKVLALRGVYYNKIDDPNKERCVGYIAQEVMEVVPELVVYSEELDMYNMNYGPMVGMLTEAVKEHHTKTVAQQAEIDTLKEQVQTLLNHINDGV